MARRGPGVGRDQVGREKGSRGRPTHRPRASRQDRAAEGSRVTAAASGRQWRGLGTGQNNQRRRRFTKAASAGHRLHTNI